MMAEFESASGAGANSNYIVLIRIFMLWLQSIVFRLFLSNANAVGTGPTCQKLYVCPASVRLSGRFFEASDWLSYLLLAVVLALRR